MRGGVPRPGGRVRGRKFGVRTWGRTEPAAWVWRLKAKLKEWCVVLLERRFEMRGTGVNPQNWFIFLFLILPPLPPKLCSNVCQRCHWQEEPDYLSGESPSYNFKIPKTKDKHSFGKSDRLTSSILPPPITSLPLYCKVKSIRQGALTVRPE